MVTMKVTTQCLPSQSCTRTLPKRFPFWTCMLRSLSTRVWSQKSGYRYVTMETICTPSLPNTVRTLCETTFHKQPPPKQLLFQNTKFFQVKYTGNHYSRNIILVLKQPWPLFHAGDLNFSIAFNFWSATTFPYFNATSDFGFGSFLQFWFCAWDLKG